MKGYPRYIATREDFENLLADPEFRDRALVDLQRIYDLQDDKIEIDVTPVDVRQKIEQGKLDPTHAVVQQISNPTPMWKRTGFGSREDILAAMKRAG